MTMRLVIAVLAAFSLSGCIWAVTPCGGGRFAEIYADATTVWPLLVKAVLEEMGKR